MPDDSSARLTTVPVLVPMPAARPYTYAVPAGEDAQPGQIVQVPLGPREVPGIVWDGAPDDVSAKRLKSITRLFDRPPLDETMRRFVDWVAEYTLTPPGLIARMVLRVPAAFEEETPTLGLRATGQRPKRATEARAKVLDLMADGDVWTKPGLIASAEVSPAVIDGLIRAGALERVPVAPPAAVPLPDPDYAAPELSPDQNAALAPIIEALRAETFKAFLLDGVTGAGKTEVYLEAIAELLKNDPDAQVLVLLPEIALTGQVLARFEDRFGARPAEWHSDVAPRQRERVWRQVGDGRVKVVAGARSALFLPFENLRLIIVDEEHDAAFKQEDGVTYHARDMAVVRASLGKCPIVLASATPSIESHVNALRGRYTRLVLPARFANSALPEIAAIDMRSDPPERGRFLSPKLCEAVGETVKRGEQALLFLNRRGYAPLTLCRACGHRFQCENCSAWLVEHRFRARLQCHHCGHTQPIPEACPECGTLDHLVACGPGVERIAEEAVERFPEARIIVLSSDLMGGVKRLRIELEAIAKGEADIVIGTQIVAKGHNFPLLSLVGIIDADLGLANADPRSAERTFQLLSQVTGRAGRTGLKSTGLIQTWQPDHPVMRALVAGDRDGFYATETRAREAGHMPPFSRLAAIIVSGEDRDAAENHARALRNVFPVDDRTQILGPAEAPLALVRGRYRFRLLVHAERRDNVQARLGAMLAAAPKPRGSVRVQIDIDPMSFF